MLSHAYCRSPASLSYLGRIELPETNSTFYGALTIPLQHSTAAVNPAPVNITAIPTTVESFPLLTPSIDESITCNFGLDRFCNANFSVSLCIGWGHPSTSFRYDIIYDPFDVHDFTLQFLSSAAAGTVTVLARCDQPPTPSQFDKSMLAVPNVPGNL